MLLSQIAKARVIDGSRVEIGNQFANFLGIRPVTVLLEVPASYTPTSALGMSLSECGPFDDRRVVTKRDDDLSYLAERFANESFAARIGIGKDVDRAILIKRELKDLENSEAVAEIVEIRLLDYSESDQMIKVGSAKKLQVF